MASNSTPNASGRGTQATTSDSKVKIDLVTMPAHEFQAALDRAKAEGRREVLAELKPAMREASAAASRASDTARMMVEFNEAMRKK